MGRFDQALFLQVLTSPLIVKAAWVTIWVATISQAIGVAIGLFVAPMMMAKARLPRLVAWLYLWIFRGTPLLVQILFFYAVLPQLGLPLGIIATGLLALGINEGARMAEIIRAGLLSVPHEQREAAAALGLTPLQTFMLVVLPQATRVIVPPLGNNYSYMIKATSLLSVISFAELLRTSQQLAQSTARPLEIYSAAALWYLGIITVVTIGQRLIEARLNRGLEQRSRRERIPTPVAAVEVIATAAPPIVADEAPAVPERPVVLEVRGITKRLGTTVAVDRVDLTVHAGEVVVIVGPSGSGKSTLLRCLNHLETPDSGVVRLQREAIGMREDAGGEMRPLPERVVEAQRRRMGMVFQRFNLFPHLTARENVALAPRRVLGVPTDAAGERADRLLTRLGVGDKAGAYPSALSGGQRQRVAIARALAMEPVVLLFDEPTSALDPEAVHEVLSAMRALADAGTTMVVVTHEIGFARLVADEVVMMDAGRIVEQGPAVSLLSAPRDPRTQAFLASLTRETAAA